MYEKIVVPLDGSIVGEAALPYVEDLVSKFSSEVEVEVILLQVLSSVTHAVLSGPAIVEIPYTEKEIEQIKNHILDYLNKAGETLRSKGIKVTTKVAIGNTSEEIVKAAEEINASFIAMSTHGRSGLSRLAFGSITDKVLRQEGNIPIIVVRSQKQPD
jgi:nucleotide-binding universal stress UspA family protein